MKAVAKPTRYAALAHRLEILEHSHHSFAMGKFTRMPELLVQTWKQPSAAWQIWKKNIADIRAAAEARGIELGDGESFEQTRAGQLLPMKLRMHGAVYSARHVATSSHLMSRAAAAM